MSEPWTPGPWTTRYVGDDDFLIYEWQVETDGECIAAMFGDNDIADARLIAAAPEMAELLEELALVWCIQQKRGGLGSATCRSPIPGEGVPEDGWCRSCRARALLSRIRGEAEVSA